MKYSAVILAILLTLAAPAAATAPKPSDLNSFPAGATWLYDQANSYWRAAYGTTSGAIATTPSFGTTGETVYAEVCGTTTVTLPGGASNRWQIHETSTTEVLIYSTGSGNAQQGYTLGTNEVLPGRAYVSSFRFWSITTIPVEIYAERE